MKRSYTGEYRRDGNNAKRTSYAEKVEPGHVSGQGYLEKLANPFETDGIPAKIPDLASYPTTTSCLQLEVTNTAFQSGTGVFSAGGVLVLMPGGVSYCPEFGADGVGTLHSTETGFKFIAPGGGGLSASNKYNAPVPSSSLGGVQSPYGNTGNANTFLPGSESLNLSCSGIRIVAAGLRVEFIGNDQNNQGLITSAFVTSMDCENSFVSYKAGTGYGGNPFCNWSSSALTVTENAAANYRLPTITQSDLENFRGNYSGPAKNGTEVVYEPLDSIDQLMSNPCPVGTSSVPYELNQYCTNDARLTQPDYWQSSTGNESDGLGVNNVGALQWHAMGISSSATFRVSIMVHYELIVRNDYTSYEKPQMCLADPIATELAQCLAAIPSATRFSAETRRQLEATCRTAYRRASHATTPAEKKSIYDWVINTGNDIINGVDKGLDLLDKTSQVYKKAKKAAWMFLP